MSGRIAASRSAAVKAAQAAKAQRDAERLEHERKVEAALADFYEGMAKATALRAQAQVRAARLIAEAEVSAVEPERAAKEALRTLAGLGESRDQIAELTGLAIADVRAALSTASASASAKRGPGGKRAAPSEPEPAERSGRPLDQSEGREVANTSLEAVSVPP
ncbi:hypothetical protein [Streptacidiphilus albus]|uniref:hypothetical protein n=1 Tax=Streptacidiphilus albus TaxID=105425 RepID=UPI00128BA3D2|nr:hypothetical protein [Streptacidiphilus albus]